MITGHGTRKCMFSIFKLNTRARYSNTKDIAFNIRGTVHHL